MELIYRYNGKAWCEDSGAGESDSLDYRAIAKMLYMGKIYE